MWPPQQVTKDSVNMIMTLSAYVLCWTKENNFQKTHWTALSIQTPWRKDCYRETRVWGPTKKSEISTFYPYKQAVLLCGSPCNQMYSLLDIMSIFTFFHFTFYIIIISWQINSYWIIKNSVSSYTLIYFILINYREGR